jgi:galactose mutarotase-like enzyme
VPADAPIRLQVDGHAVTIDPSAGARLSDWRIGDLDLLAHYSDAPVNWGMYPMAPWAGRLRDNTVVHPDATVTLPVSHDVWALHGTVLSAPGAVEQVQHGAHEAVARLSFDDHGDWPWPIRVVVEYRLTADVLTTVIEVQAERTSPAVVGWHPWFRRRLARGEPARWSLAAQAKAERGPDALPTGALVPYDPDSGPFDDAFLVPEGRASIAWPGALVIDIDWDGPWCVVFDELAPALCVEPQSGPPNGVNDGLGRPLTVAAPGRPHRMVTRWRLRSDAPPGDRA